MPPAPSVPSQSLLVLDGQAASMKSVDGGAIKGEVVIVNSGSEKFAQKQIAGVRFEPFTFEVGLGMGKSLVQWIAGSLDLSRTRRSGSVVTTNFDHKAQGYRHFRDALITEITVPKMDGSSKDAGYFTIKFDPEEITYAKGDGAAIQDGVNTKQKAWLCSNFRLRVGKLPCARVASIDAFTIKQGTGIEFPNLKIRFSAADAAAWQDWFNEFVVQGRNGQDKELDGAIEFLDPTLKEVLGSIELSQIGIFSLAPEKQEAGPEAVARFSVELYVEQMTLNIKAV